MLPQYCCFYLHQTLRVGWARAQRGVYLELVLPEGETVRQRAANMMHCWQGEPAAGEADALEQLRRHGAHPDAQRAAVDALYASLPAGEPVDFDTLAQRALPAEAGGWARGQLFMGLLRDKTRFRYSNGAFTARGTEEVAERAARAAEERRRRDWSDRAVRWRDALEAGRWPHGDDPEAARFLEQLQSLLALEKRSPYWGVLARPLGLYNLHVLDLATRIKGWLQTAGAWPGWPRIWLEWGGVARGFAPEHEQAARALARKPLRGGGRADYRAADTYTIDSEGTRDYDDGFSIVEAEPGAVTVAMHIAEPDPELAPGHPLFDEAARRMSSVYTLEGTFPMLPPSLSVERFSLVAGAEREAVTFVLRLHGGEAELLDVQRSVVRVRGNLKYGQGQRLLDDQPECWGRLAAQCARLSERRAELGAVIVERHETYLDVSDPARIRVYEVWRTEPVHQVVEEMAILYNREAGRYCSRHGLPAIYRVQPPAHGVGGWDEPGAMHMSARFSTEPGPHAGLGCDRYLQASSPIRRFPDLVMQRQMAEHAAGGAPPFSGRGLLEAWAEQADSRLNTYDEVTQRIENDWKRRYLEQNRQRVFEGVAQRRRESGHGRVTLRPLRLTAQCVLPAGVEEGDRVRVKVESIDRDHRTVWVRCVE